MPLTVLSVSYPLAQVSSRTAGGAEQVLAQLDKGLVEAGHRSLVLAPVGSRCSGLLISAQLPAGVLNHDARRIARRTFKKLIDRTLDEYPVDIVHMHGLDFHEYLPESDIPTAVTLHLPLSWYAPEALRFFQPDVSFICVSKSQASTASAGTRIGRVILNGIDLRLFAPAPRKSNYAVVVSRICPEKGIHLAIDAAERAGLDLIIAGSVFEYPEHRRYFDSMVRSRLNGSIRFIGPVGGRHKAALLGAARCVLIPTLAPETSSLVAMEAMAAGTPVVAFPTGAIPQIVSDGRTGFLVSNVEEMARAITQTESLEAAECRKEAERKFSSQRMVREYVDLYQSILKGANAVDLQAA
ncbi:MAG TPA: glycosyltransferase family 4 protein [Terriglobales bacterium]|nr:glycosyltransferase family 4 protein [Terriglobales bacterium]